MQPQHDETTELLALPYETGVEGGEPLRRRVDRYARRRQGRRAAVLSAVAPLLVMSAVAAMAATSTGPFDPGSSGRIVTASVVAPRQQEPSPTPSETAPSVEPNPAAPAEPVAVAPPPPPPVPEPYLVAPGDTMATVEQHCGTPWRRVFDANPEIADPDELHAGIVVRCPAPDEQLAERPLTAPTPDPPPEEDDEEPAPEPEPEPEPPSDAGVWDRLAECESGGNWSINTGNGYYGGLQFSLSSWRAVGGSGYPHENSKAEQIHRGELLQAAQGWDAWPTCARKLGLT